MKARVLSGMFQRGDPEKSGLHTCLAHTRCGQPQLAGASQRKPRMEDPSGAPQSQPTTGGPGARVPQAPVAAHTGDSRAGPSLGAERRFPLGWPGGMGSTSPWSSPSSPYTPVPRGRYELGLGVTTGDCGSTQLRGRRAQFCGRAAGVPRGGDVRGHFLFPSFGCSAVDTGPVEASCCPAGNERPRSGAKGDCHVQRGARGRRNSKRHPFQLCVNAYDHPPAARALTLNGHRGQN